MIQDSAFQTAIATFKELTEQNRTRKDPILTALEKTIQTCLTDPDIAQLSAKDKSALADLIASYTSLLASTTTDQLNYAKLLARRQEMVTDQGTAQIVAEYMKKIGRSALLIDPGTASISKDHEKLLQERGQSLAPIQAGELSLGEDTEQPETT